MFIYIYADMKTGQKSDKYIRIRMTFIPIVIELRQA